MRAVYKKKYQFYEEWHSQITWLTKICKFNKCDCIYVCVCAMTPQYM